MKVRKLSALVTVFLLMVSLLSGCGNSENTIVIYTSIEDYVVEDMSARLREVFPQYDFAIEYFSTGNHAARLMAEGPASECDITYNLEYAYLAQLDEQGSLADLSAYDRSIYCEDTVESDYYLVQYRNGGSVILNTEVLAQRNLPEPASYQDLLKPEYRGLISMPNPKSSGTGYMFLKSLVNAWGEEAALDYFDRLTPNILQYTSSGSGPVNALIQGEAAIGLGMTAQAVTQINEGAPLKIVFFEEGSPFSLYGMGILSGKETRQCVKDVFDFLVNTYSYELNEKFFPEQMFRDKVYAVKNYPQNIHYSDMSGDSFSKKGALLDKWKY